jgi:hypothetical protein
VSVNVYLIRSGFVVRIDRASFSNDPPAARDDQFSATAIARTRAGADLTLKIDEIETFEAAQFADGFLARFESPNGLCVAVVFEEGLHHLGTMLTPSPIGVDDMIVTRRA